MLRSVVAFAVFAIVALGQTPEGWRLGGGDISKYYEVTLDKQIKKTGQASARLRSIADQPAVPFGNLLQSILADEYRGKRVRLSGYVRTTGNDKGAWMWLRADTPTMWRLDNMNDRLIKDASDWHRAEIVMDIPDDTQALFIGFALFGTGQLWVDEVSFEVVSKDLATTTTIKDPTLSEEVNKGRQESFEKRRATMQKTLTNLGFEN